MDNKEFEKELEKIKKFKEVPISIDEKIQKAFSRIEENEKQEKEIRKTKFNFSRILSMAACLIMVIFLAGNGVAYAYGMPNIYSWVLDKINLSEIYEENKQEIGINENFEGTDLTIENAMIDEEILIVCYNLKTNKELNGKVYLFGNKLVSLDNKTISVEYTNTSIERENRTISQKINNNEYRIYEIYDIEELGVGNSYVIDINCDGICDSDSIEGVGYEDGGYSVEGKWNFKFNVEKQSQNTNIKTYKIDNNKLELEAEARKNNMGYENNNVVKELKEVNNIGVLDLDIGETLFSNIWDGEVADGISGMLYLTVQINNEDGDVIIEKGAQTILNGGESRLILGDIDINEELEINIYNQNEMLNKNNERYELIGKINLKINE